MIRAQRFQVAAGGALVGAILMAAALAIAAPREFATSPALEFGIARQEGGSK